MKILEFSLTFELKFMNSKGTLKLIIIRLLNNNQKQNKKKPMEQPSIATIWIN